MKLGETLTGTQALAPAVVVVVPLGHGVAAVAPEVATKDPIGAGTQEDCPARL